MKCQIFLISMLLFLCGCFNFQLEEHFILNPNGSGKVHVKLIMPSEATHGSLEEEAEKLARNLISTIPGEEKERIESWKDVSYRGIDGNKLLFEGTAYFRDYSYMFLKSQGFLVQSEFIPHNNGTSTLEFHLGEEKTRRVITNENFFYHYPSDYSFSLSEGEIARKMEIKRESYKQSKERDEEDVKDLRLRFSYQLPGKLVTQSNLRQDQAGNIFFELDGKTLLHVLDQLIKDDTWVRNEVLGDEHNIDAQRLADWFLNKKMFGERMPIQAVLVSDKAPLFDYEAEVKANRKDYQRLRKSLGVK